MFAWNYSLVKAMDGLDRCWTLPIIHGFVDQSKISVFGHDIFVTLIARRSRHFAGARYLKRGVNDQGYVANDVETEQIVHDASTTFFPTSEYYQGYGYTSFLQHRGSIPLYWSQEAVATNPKPNIQMDIIDPYYTASAKHFDNLFLRYGSPIIVLNLVKYKERVKRESLLLNHFTECINYLNQSLPTENKIKYIAWDMARASKSQDQDVIGKLEKIAEECIAMNSFFYSGKSKESSNTSLFPNSIQHGIVRTNCIDCLDRTNAAQFIIAKCALGHQLYALGIISKPKILFDCDAINLLNSMYHDHGDTIALQYGGSQLAHTMETYRKISRWTSHSRDMIESIKRYYSNSFTDSEKQDAMNLFLGLYTPRAGNLPLWELPTDYFLHNDPFNRILPKSYINWVTPEHLLPRKLLPLRSWSPTTFEVYYEPKEYTDLNQHFAFNLISTSAKEDLPEISPFVVRVNPQQTTRYFMMYSLDIGGVKRWLTVNQKSFTPDEESKKTGKFKKHKCYENRTQRKLTNPVVVPEEKHEYKRYVAQFKPSSTDFDFSIESFENEIPEYKIYQSYVQSVSSSVLNRWGVGDMLDSSNECIYRKYVQHQGSVESMLGIGCSQNKLEDGYRRWIIKGAYPSRMKGRNNQKISRSPSSDLTASPQTAPAQNTHRIPFSSDSFPINKIF